METEKIKLPAAGENNSKPIVVQIKLSGLPIPMEVIVNNDKQKEEIINWAKKHSHIRWIDIKTQAVYGEELTYDEWNKRYNR